MKSDFEINCFKIFIDADHFEPADITVRTNNNSVLVEGKHKDGGHSNNPGLCNFTETFSLPEDVLGQDIECNYLQLGILEIFAPKHHNRVGNVQVACCEELSPISSPQNPTTKMQQRNHIYAIPVNQNIEEQTQVRWYSNQQVFRSEEVNLKLLRDYKFSGQKKQLSSHSDKEK